MIEVRGLSKKFIDQIALSNTSWKVEPNRALGLLGPNGAGKSTTMKIITGLLYPDEGEILVNGEDYFANPIAAKSQIGYLPEIPPLYPELNTYQNLDFICGLRKVSPAERETQISSAIDKLGLAQVAHKPCRVLSKGFRQRLGIAQTLMGNPPILILDEPSVGLDPQNVFELRKVLLQLKKDHTLVLSSHVLSEVQQVCDDVVILDKGKIKAFGPINKILLGPKSQTVVTIAINRCPPGLVEKLEALDIVSQVQFSDYHLELFCHSPSVDNMNPFVQILLDTGVQIQSINRKQQSLEDFFIEVTQ